MQPIRPHSRAIVGRDGEAARARACPAGVWGRIMAASV
jgi:hypothetical protein